MLSIQVLLPLALSVSTAFAACPPPAPDPGYGVPPFYGYPPHAPFQCGKTDVYFTGLPPNHPTVISQGYPPDFVAAALAQDKARILAAGYNLKTVLQGPEEDINNNAVELFTKPTGVLYDVYIGGFGVRGAPYVNLTAQFENDLSFFRKYLPNAPFGFNISPNSSLEALRRVGPIQGSCAGKPGKDYGTYIYCSPKVCTVPYSPKIGTTYP